MKAADDALQQAVARARFLEVHAGSRAGSTCRDLIGYCAREARGRSAATLACTAEVIATRNVTDFKRSPLPARTPAQVLAELGRR